MAQKLSHQLRAAEDRIAELEAEVGLYRDKADRAEQWLHKVYTEIEELFIKRPQEKSRAVSQSHAYSQAVVTQGRRTVWLGG